MSRVVINTLLALALMAPGCVTPPGLQPQHASAATMGGGSALVIVVGVFQDRVQPDGPCDDTCSRARYSCAMSDWRVTFTTEYHKAAGTYEYDTNKTQEFSVRTNDTALRAALNETMRSEKPATLSWIIVADRGCEYEHDHVVTGVTPFNQTDPA